MSQVLKKQARLRRAKKLRAQVRRLGVCRFTVHRSSRHIYAQVISADGRSTVATASTLDKEIRAQCETPGNCAGAAQVGKLVAQRALAADVRMVAFDRSGFKYHGRIKALAEAARAAGIQF